MRGAAVARMVTLLIAVVAALGGAAPAIAQESLVDRIAAVVNGEVISRQQLERAVSAAGQAQDDVTATCTPPASGSTDLQARVLECMVDDLLKFQHVRRFPQFDVLPEAVETAYDRLVERYDSRAAFDEALRQQQKTAADVRYDLERAALISNYVNVRYREVVDISEREILRYYEEVLRPEMQRQGAELPALEAVDDEFIAPLLTEIEVNRRVDEWVVELRRRASIVVYTW